MAKFTVCIHQYVERVATHEVEAESAEAAAEAARRYLMQGGNLSTLDFTEGDDAHDAEIYAVLDADGESCWEE